MLHVITGPSSLALRTRRGAGCQERKPVQIDRTDGGGQTGRTALGTVPRSPSSKKDKALRVISGLKP
jgi:hypothetical protein